MRTDRHQQAGHEAHAPKRKCVVCSLHRLPSPTQGFSITLATAPQKACRQLSTCLPCPPCPHAKTDARPYSVHLDNDQRARVPRHPRPTARRASRPSTHRNASQRTLFASPRPPKTATSRSRSSPIPTTFLPHGAMCRVLTPFAPSDLRFQQRAWHVWHNACRSFSAPPTHAMMGPSCKTFRRRFVKRADDRARRRECFTGI
ncbi:hypothetical protein BS50DRAFT_38094 [Corynespora cassiicola Philippines]|uniref:Uncharacterized protein n=1 Tax=Corynespora cassiicola Philippines TaxID=1448308 RepID=A0A2T2PCH1_CORCC|nr:hypothetical protein BS50DRAFT_38094 [Corynespora cassiicola Philippines]